MMEVMEVIALKSEAGLLRRSLLAWVERWLAWQHEQELEEQLER